MTEVPKAALHSYELFTSLNTKTLFFFFKWGNTGL